MRSVFALMIRLYELSPLIGRLWQQLVLGRLKIKSKPLAGKWNNQASERRKEKRYQNPIVTLKELREKGNVILRFMLPSFSLCKTSLYPFSAFLPCLWILLRNLHCFVNFKRESRASFSNLIFTVPFQKRNYQINKLSLYITRDSCFPEMY